MTATNTHPVHSTAYSQAKQGQAYLHETAAKLKEDATQVEDPETRARVASGIAACYRAWCDLEERKRVLKMKPLPKSVDVTTYRRRNKKSPTPPPNFIPVAIPESSHGESQIESPKSTSTDTDSDTPILPNNDADSSKNVA